MEEFIKEMFRVRNEQAEFEMKLMDDVYHGFIDMNQWEKRMTKRNELFKLEVLHLMTEYLENDEETK